MTPPLRTLYLEDDPKDAELVQEALEGDGIICQVTRVATQADFIASLEQGGFGVILADYALPSFDGLSALKIAQQRCPHVPFIFVSGTLGEEVAVEALKIGATDYVRKTLLSRIVPSVQRALREARERVELSHAAAALRRSQAYLAEAQCLSHTGSFGWNLSSGEIYWSDETYRLVTGDATRPHQVVTNLCNNAIQAMSGGGSLHVALEAADVSTGRALSHGALRPGRYVRLTVKDDGSGMDEATLSRIFEPFFTTKEAGQGTGLGLSLVYAIVTDSGGAIDVKSAPGLGSTFTIYLPHSPVTLITAEAATAEVLSRLGYEAVSFSDSRAALAAFETMPGLTGTGLARVLRGRRPDLPVVLMSGYTGAIQTQQSLAASVSRRLSKPIQSREMAAALARVLHHTA